MPKYEVPESGFCSLPGMEPLSPKQLKAASDLLNAEHQNLTETQIDKIVADAR